MRWCKRCYREQVYQGAIRWHWLAAPRDAISAMDYIGYRIHPRSSFARALRVAIIATINIARHKLRKKSHEHITRLDFGFVHPGGVDSVA
jgi:hypothetical protein